MMRFLSVLLCGLLLSAQTLAAPAPSEEISEAEAEILKKELRDAELYRYMLNTKARINLLAPVMCGKHIKQARKHRKALEALDRQYTGRYDHAYQRKFQDLKGQHQKATGDYKRCFTRKIREPRHEKLRPRYINSYEMFRTVEAELAGKFKPVGTLDTRIAEIKEKLQTYNDLNKIEDPNFKPYAKIVALRGRVHSGHSKNPASRMRRAAVGERLAHWEAVETGSDGVAGIIVVTGRHDKTLEIFLGRNTRIEMKKHLPGKPVTVTTLVKGAMRAFAKNWGFRTRGGTRGGGAGIRGTEGSFSYDPKTNVFQAHLAHGDAYVFSGGREVTLKPATSLTIKKGRIGKPRKVSRSQWNKIVASTGDGRQNPASAAKWGTGPRQIAQRRRGGGSVAAIDRVMRSYARSVTETLLFALRVNDGNALLARTGGKFHADYRKGLKTQSLKNILDKRRNRPRSHKFRCAHCDTRKGACQVLMDVQQEAHKTGRVTPVLFDIRKTGRASELRAFGANLGQGDRLKNFMAKKPVCEKR